MLLMQLPLEKPGSYSNDRQTTTLLTYTDVSKLVIKGTGEVVTCPLYGGKSKDTLTFKTSKIDFECQSCLQAFHDNSSLQVN